MREDYIDFPCSADWLDHYHRIGLTPRGSGRADPELRRVWDHIQKIEERQLRIEELLLETLNILKETHTRGSTVDNSNTVRKRFEYLEEG